MATRKLEDLLKTKKREITLILVSIMVLGLFFSGSSMSKQLNRTQIETNSKIAEPIVVIERQPIIEVNGEKEREMYHFKVKNYKENGEVTQIDLVYYLEILLPTEESFSFKLYQDGQEVPFSNHKTTVRKLKKESIQEDDYQLEMIYDKTRNHAKDDMIQEVQIKVHVEQVKI